MGLRVGHGAYWPTAGTGCTTRPAGRVFSCCCVSLPGVEIEPQPVLPAPADSQTPWKFPTSGCTRHGIRILDALPLPSVVSPLVVSEGFPFSLQCSLKWSRCSQSDVAYLHLTDDAHGSSSCEAHIGRACFHTEWPVHAHLRRRALPTSFSQTDSQDHEGPSFRHQVEDHLGHACIASDCLRDRLHRQA